MSTLSAAPAANPRPCVRCGGPLGWWWNCVNHQFALHRLEVTP